MRGPIHSKMPLPADEVHVWLCELSVSKSALSRLGALLSPAEQSRASRFTRPTDSDRFIASHGISRVILGRYLGWESDTLRFAAGKNGKPFLSDSESSWLDFNLSRSGDRMAVA